MLKYSQPAINPHAVVLKLRNYSWNVPMKKIIQIFYRTVDPCLKKLGVSMFWFSIALFREANPLFDSVS